MKLTSYLLLILGLLLAITPTIALIGCQSQTNSDRTKKFEGNVEWEYSYAPNGTPILHVKSETNMTGKQGTTIIPPPNAQDAPTITQDDDSTTVTGGAAFPPQVVQAITKNANTFYIASIACFVLAAALFFWPWAKALPGSGGAAIGAAVTGGLLAVLPSTVERFGVAIGVMGLFTLIGTAFWIVHRKNKRVVDTAVAEQVAMGNAAGGTVIRTANDSDYRATLQRVAKKMTPAPSPTPVVPVIPTVPTPQD